MITLLTGLPGNGKTLFALFSVKAQAEKETREVYYHNIKDLNLPWTVCDPEKWMDLPNGSIIVIDEAQDVFPKKPNGSQLPVWYTELAKHRHKGFDIYVITQHPTLLDNFVRQLVGRHYHSIRKFGLERSTIYEWSAANPAPQNAASHKNAVTFKWSYPKEVYSYYKSAEVHTVKKSIPLKLILAVVFVLSVPVVGYYALDHFQNRAKNQASVSAPAPGAASAGGATLASVVPPQQKVAFDPVADARQYIAVNTPRVAGLPQTAPKYDDLTKPVRVPVPAACIATASVCKCFSQQGTAMGVEPGMCKEFAKNGYFQEFDADKDKAAVAHAEKSSKILDEGPSSTGGVSVALSSVESVVSSGARSLRQ